MKFINILFLLLIYNTSWAISNSSKVRIISQKSGQIENKETEPQDENKMSYYFQKNDCASVFSEFEKRTYKQLSGLEIAIVASCEPADKDPEKMFKYAEDREPTNDFIVLLHARYRWKKYFVNAMDLWVKLAHEAKDPRIRSLAAEYLNSSEKTDFFFEDFFIPTAFSLQLSSFWESNPAQYADSDPLSKTESSAGTTEVVSLIRHKDFSFGYLDGTVSFIGTQYFTSSEINSFAIDVNGGLTIPTSQRRSFIIKPIGNMTGLDGSVVNMLAGFSFGEIWNFEKFQMMILMSLAVDKYHQGALVQQQGTHKKMDLRFDIDSIETYDIYSALSAEGTLAGQDVNGSEVIPYSNAQYTFQFGLQKNLDPIALGISFSDTLRIDELESQYTNTNGVATVKQRRDNSMSGEIWLSKRFFKKLDLITYFRYQKTDSNMNATDLTDRNIKNSVLGLNARMSF